MGKVSQQSEWLLNKSWLGQMGIRQTCPNRINDNKIDQGVRGTWANLRILCLHDKCSLN